MRTGLSLEDLAKKITALQTLKQDFIAPAAALSMQVQTNQDAMTSEEKRHTIVLDVPSHGTYPILATAHDQIGTHLKIPAAYYDRCLHTQPGLLAENVNTWLRADKTKRMIRTLGGDTRAFLSNAYQRIENEEIAAIALPVLMDIPGIKVVSCEVTDRRMYIQATTPRITGEVKKGDAVQAGVLISNSEIGQGSVSVKPLVFRLVCLNGMVLPDGRFTGRHVGRRVEDTEALWAEDTRKADDRAVLLKVRDTVKAAVDEAMFNERLDKMKGLAGVQVTGSPEKAIEVLAQKIDVTDSEQGDILRALIKGADLSAWGMLNAVTAAAHNAKSYDRSVEFEAMGGALLDLPAGEWKQVLEAA